MATAMATQSTGQNSFIARNWRDLIRPRNLEVEPESLTATYGKFTCEPLERGFGTTLGNSLRRILLSSLPGYALTEVQIEGVLHEYSTLDGVREDVVDILLNLKGVVLKLHQGEDALLSLKKKGEYHAVILRPTTRTVSVATLEEIAKAFETAKPAQRIHLKRALTLR